MSIHGLLILTDFNYEKTSDVVEVSPQLSQRRRKFSEEKYCAGFVAFDKETVQEYLSRERF